MVKSTQDSTEKKDKTLSLKSSQKSEKNNKSKIQCNQIKNESSADNNNSNTSSSNSSKTSSQNSKKTISQKSDISKSSKDIKKPSKEAKGNDTPCFRQSEKAPISQRVKTEGPLIAQSQQEQQNKNAMVSTANTTPSSTFPQSKNIGKQRVQSKASDVFKKMVNYFRDFKLTINKELQHLYNHTKQVISEEMNDHEMSSDDDSENKESKRQSKADQVRKSQASRSGSDSSNSDSVHEKTKSIVKPPIQPLRLSHQQPLGRSSYQQQKLKNNDSDDEFKPNSGPKKIRGKRGRPPKLNRPQSVYVQNDESSNDKIKRPRKPRGSKIGLSSVDFPSKMSQSPKPKYDAQGNIVLPKKRGRKPKNFQAIQQQHQSSSIQIKTHSSANEPKIKQERKQNESEDLEALLEKEMLNKEDKAQTSNNKQLKMEESDSSGSDSQ